MWDCFFGYSYQITGFVLQGIFFGTHVTLRPTFFTQNIFHRYDYHICDISRVLAKWPTTQLKTTQSDCKKSTWSPTWWACSTCPCQPPLEANRSPDRTQLVVLPAFLYVKKLSLVMDEIMWIAENISLSRVEICTSWFATAFGPNCSLVWPPGLKAIVFYTQSLLSSILSCRKTLTKSKEGEEEEGAHLGNDGESNWSWVTAMGQAGW